MKLYIENIPFRNYTSLNNETRQKYDYYLRYGELKPIDYFKLGDFMELNFGFVKDMQEYLNYTGLTWKSYLTDLAKYIKKPLKLIAKTPIFFLYQSKLFIKEQIEIINKLENDNLSHTASSDEERAGIEIFNKYRSFLQFDSLTHGDLTKLEQIKKLPYSICYAKLLLEHDKSIYENDLNRILRSKK